MYYYYFLWFELLSFLVALYNYRYLKGSNLFLFIPFLFLTNLQEWGGRIGLFNIGDSNTVSQNIFTFIEFIFYSWLFIREVNSILLRKFIIAASISFIVYTLFSFIFNPGIFVFYLYPYLTGSILMVLFSCLYFFNLLRSEEYIELRKFPMFWVCIGIMFFYTGMFSVYMFILQGNKPAHYDYQRLFNIVSNIFNIILYSCFIIAFICHRIRKSIPR